MLNQYMDFDFHFLLFHRLRPATITLLYSEFVPILMSVAPPPAPLIAWYEVLFAVFPTAFPPPLYPPLAKTFPADVFPFPPTCTCKIVPLVNVTTPSEYPPFPPATKVPVPASPSPP